MEYVLKAHMPGLVARVTCEVGQKVEAGQEMAVISCMKMESSVCTVNPGTVKEILVAEWDELDVGTPMIIMEE